jgi:hypothetical protein
MTSPIRSLLIVLTLAVLVIASACNVSADAAPTATPDIQATIDAATLATSTAGMAVQATVDSAVQATVQALPPTPTAGPEIDYVTLSEEELEALIDEAVTEAVEATQYSYTATTQATSDGTVTAEEVEQVESYIYWSEEAIAEAEELIDAYYGLYADLAYETIALLDDIEDDLSAMSEDISEIANVMEQGAEAASAAIEQLNTAVQNAGQQAEQTQQAVQGLVEQAKEEREQRVTAVLSETPTMVADDVKGTVSLLHNFTESIKLGFEDGKISLDELAGIAQFGNSARASIEKLGGGDLSSFSGGITKLTEQIARGEWTQARADLPNFEGQLPQRPEGFSMPDLPSGGLDLPGGKRK